MSARASQALSVDGTSSGTHVSGIMVTQRTLAAMTVMAMFFGCGGPAFGVAGGVAGDPPSAADGGSTPPDGTTPLGDDPSSDAAGGDVGEAQADPPSADGAGLADARATKVLLLEAGPGDAALIDSQASDGGVVDAQAGDAFVEPCDGELCVVDGADCINAEVLGCGPIDLQDAGDICEGAGVGGGVQSIYQCDSDPVDVGGCVRADVDSGSGATFCCGRYATWCGYTAPAPSTTLSEPCDSGFCATEGGSCANADVLGCSYVLTYNGASTAALCPGIPGCSPLSTLGSVSACLDEEETMTYQCPSSVGAIAGCVEASTVLPDAGLPAGFLCCTAAAMCASH